jgi:hypothetical protein
VSTTDTEVKRVDKMIADLESDLQGNSLLYDEVKDRTENFMKSVKKCADTRVVEKELCDLNKKHDELSEKYLLAQCRSMKYNLPFGGIAEKEDKVCEETVKKMLDTEMNV